MNVGIILAPFICFFCVFTTTAEDLKDEGGIPLTEGKLDDDEKLDEIEVNQNDDQYVGSSKGNGVDEFEGDIMMTAEHWEELKREFERTGQSLPNQ